ncbi:MAG TPA: FkbM family methyltransferase [Candidatus Binataceae bacterium]|nr:FkbM family methyltransferase [Candidatus Binataceae bacterium]
MAGGPFLDMTKIRHFFRRGLKAARLACDAKFRRGLRRGVAAAIEHRALLSPLDVRTVVDIGANLGQFSLLSWRLYPNAKIYAFEPQPAPAVRYLKVLGVDSPARLFQAAISTKMGFVEMHISRRHDSSSLLPISEIMSTVFPGTEEIGVARVESGPLKNFIAADDVIEPALLKIDVQGGELDTLIACDDFLEHFRYVFVELSFIELYRGQALFTDVVRHLDRKGYDLRGIDNLARDQSGCPIQADCLFARRTHAARIQQHQPPKLNVVG